MPDYVTELTFPTSRAWSWTSSSASWSSGPRRSWPRQGRLRGLLRATQMINGGLTLPVCCTASPKQRVSWSAPATPRWACSPRRRAGRVRPHGMPPELVARIGHLPQGKGLLGALIENPEPIRLARISDDHGHAASHRVTRR